MEKGRNGIANSMANIPVPMDSPKTRGQRFLWAKTANPKGAFASTALEFEMAGTILLMGKKGRDMVLV